MDNRQWLFFEAWRNHQNDGEHHHDDEAVTSDEDLRQAVKQTEEHLKAQPAARNVVAISWKP